MLFVMRDVTLPCTFPHIDNLEYEKYLFNEFEIVISTVHVGL